MVRLQFVAIEADGASTQVQKVPDALRVDLILGNGKEKVPASGGFSIRSAFRIGEPSPIARAKRRLAKGAI